MKKLIQQLIRQFKQRCKKQIERNPYDRANGYQGIQWNTHDNFIGTSGEVEEHISNLIGTRILMDNAPSISDQLSEIESTKYKCGRVMIFIKNVPAQDKVIANLETIFVQIR